MEEATFEGVLGRIAETAETKNQRELAEALGISEQAVSKGLRGNAIPSTWVYKIARKYAVSVDWLFTGKGPKGGKDFEGVSGSPVDMELLASVIEVLEEYLDGIGKQLSAHAKAQVICLLYELMQKKDVDAKQQPLRVIKAIKESLAAM